MQSISPVMSECFLSGRGQGHVSNFYIVDLENVATASRRCTGVIKVYVESSMVSLWITHTTVERVVAECTSLSYVGRQ